MVADNAGQEGAKVELALCHGAEYAKTWSPWAKEK